jgi:hypothetical protein
VQRREGGEAFVAHAGAASSMHRAPHRIAPIRAPRLSCTTRSLTTVIPRCRWRAPWARRTIDAMRRAFLLCFSLAVASTTPGCAVDKTSGGEPLDGGKLDSGTIFLDSEPSKFDVRNDTTLDPDAACGVVSEEATFSPVDLFIMFDKSSSMAGTKWNAAKAGLGTYVKSKDAEGLHVALNFFPRPPDTTPACDQPIYASARVPFGDLPAIADSIIAAIGAETPDGFNTPIYPALGGALIGAGAEATKRAGDKGAVLLVTDGEPVGPATTCGGVNPEDPAVVAALAKKAFDEYRLSTFVIGLPGVNPTVANQIAAAGGTTTAIVITDPTKVETEFAAALGAVRGKALGCEFALPEKVKGGEFSTSLVNVQYTKGSGVNVELYKTDDCSKGGWRYDSDTAPTKIILCPSTCDEVRADLKAKILVLLGCATKIR